MNDKKEIDRTHVKPSRQKILEDVHESAHVILYKYGDQRLDTCGHDAARVAQLC